MCVYCGRGVLWCVRLTVGLVVKEAQDLWRTCVDVSCAWGLASYPQDPGGVLQRHGRLMRQIEEMGLDGIWTLKPLMDGKSLITATGIKKVGNKDPHGLELQLSLVSHSQLLFFVWWGVCVQGPLVGKLMAEQTRWQIGHPQGSLEECLEHLKAYAAQEKDR